MSHRWDRKPPLEVEIDRHHWQSQGLIGFWTPRAGAGATLHDASVYLNHGTLTNMDSATAWKTDGLNFDGTNDFVACGTHSRYAPAALTVTFWFRSDVTPTLFDAVISKTNGLTWTTGWGIYWNSATVLKAQVYTTYNAGPEATFSSPTSWNHCAVRISPRLGQCDLFANGVAGTPYMTVNSPTGTGNSLQLGQMGGSSYNLDGLLDDVRIYDRDLTDAQIVDLMRRPHDIWQPRRQYWFGSGALSEADGSASGSSSVAAVGAAWYAAAASAAGSASVLGDGAQLLVFASAGIAAASSSGCSLVATTFSAAGTSSAAAQTEQSQRRGRLAAGRVRRQSQLVSRVE